MSPFAAALGILVELSRGVHRDRGGSELDLWAYGHGVRLDFGRPGQPTDTASIESCNARVRTECLNQNRFMDLDDARRKVADRRVEANEVSPPSAIGVRPPIALKASGSPEAATEPGTLA